jgi:hypothetical protein
LRCKAITERSRERIVGAHLLGHPRGPDELSDHLLFASRENI